MDMKDLKTKYFSLSKITDIHLLGGISSISYTAEVTDAHVTLVQLDITNETRREALSGSGIILPFSLVNEKYLYIVLQCNDQQEICRISHTSLFVEKWSIATLKEFDIFEATDDRYIVFRSDDLPGDYLELVIMDLQLNRHATIKIGPEDDFDFSVVTDIYKRPTHILGRNMNDFSKIEFVTWQSVLNQVVWA